MKWYEILFEFEGPHGRLDGRLECQAENLLDANKKAWEFLPTDWIIYGIHELDDEDIIS